jgi:hypothetical protein
VIGHEIPRGLVGLHPREPIGAHVNVAIKGKSGAPDYKGRFWLTSQLTHSAEFTAGSGKTYRQLARDLHPSFAAWNDAALALGRDLTRKGPGRLGVLRGNLVHARFSDAAFWNRAAQKLPEGHPNPPSRRPACEGDGVSALRFRGVENGKEIFDRIACPNRECIFAQQGLCKVAADLIFRLRWNPTDAWESQFPSLLVEWATRGRESAENMLGLFEHVIGSEALLTEDQRRLATDEEREAWKSGMAQEMGVLSPSLVGMPFVMSVGDKTKAADASSPTGKRYPVVQFSPDGDLVEWLILQGRRRRELVAIPEALALPPASVNDPSFLEAGRHESRIEIDPSVIESSSPAIASPTLDVPESQGDGGEISSTGGDLATQTINSSSDIEDDSPGVPQEPPGPARLDANARRRIQAAAPDGIDLIEIERLAGGPLEEQPATAEAEILRALRDWKPTKPAGRKR